MNSRKGCCWLGMGLALFLASDQALQAASLDVYLASPSSQSSTVSGISTATFDTLTPGIDTTAYVSPIGTFNFSAATPISVQSANQYGGANATNYIALGAQSSSSAPITVMLNSPQNYLGFWFSAGDPNNGVTFYSSGTAVAHLTTATILSFLSGSTVTAINGTTYSTSSYKGNPNPGAVGGQDSSEVFSYIDIFANGLTFDEIVLDNSGTTSTGFESDNYSTALVSMGTTAPVTDVSVYSITPVPEPSEYAMMLGGVILFLVGSQRLREKFGRLQIA